MDFRLTCSRKGGKGEEEESDHNLLMAEFLLYSSVNSVTNKVLFTWFFSWRESTFEKKMYRGSRV